MIGLAKMAWTLADIRAFPELEPSLPLHALAERSEAMRVSEFGNVVLPASHEYYAIIDRITRGEKP